jgi:hypothetical protein
MTENADESTKITKGAYVVIFLYGCFAVTIFTSYTEFFILQIAEWSGEQITNDWFEVSLMIIAFTVIGLIMIRYRTASYRIEEAFFTDNGVTFWKAATAIIMLFVLMFISFIILLSVIAFILGTGFSLGMLSQPEMDIDE